MTRSRLALVLSATVVALGATAALGTLWLDSARADVGPLPGKGLVLPADTQFVMGVDVKRLTASPMWARWTQDKAMRPETLDQLERWTGLDPRRDIDQIVVAGRGRQEEKQLTPLVMATGRFNLEKLDRSLDQAGQGAKSHLEGATLFTMEKKGVSSSLVILDVNTLIFGPTDRVQEVLGSRARGETPLRENAELMALVQSVKPGSTFWLAGDQSLLASMPKGIPAPGMGGSGGAPQMNLPPLQSLTLTGDLDPQLSLALTGVAADEVAATKLADVVRGLVALMSLQAGQKPELEQLASAFSVSTEANRVLIDARISYELLEALRPKKEPVPEVEAEDADTEEGTQSLGAASRNGARTR